MNRILVFACISLSLLSFSAAAQEAARPQTPEELGNAVFAALQQDDFASFKQLMFTSEDCEKMAHYSDLQGDDRQKAAKRMYAVMQKYQAVAESNFNEVIKQGKVHGIEWKSASLNAVKAEVLTRDGIQMTDAFLICEFKRKQFVIKLDNCHKSDAWLLLDTMELTTETN